jgi:hypothetical protein
MEKILIEEIFRIKSMMGINESKTLLMEQPVASLLTKWLRSSADEIIETFTETTVSGGRKVVRFAGQDLEPSVAARLRAFIKNEINDLSDDEFEILRNGFFKIAKESAVGTPLRTSYDNIVDDIYTSVMTTQLKLIGKSEKEFLELLKTEKNIDEILDGFSLDSTYRKLLKEKILSRMKGEGKALDLMIYSGGKTLDDILADPMISAAEKARIKAAGITDEMIESWYKAAETNAALFKQEFLLALKKSKEEIELELNAISIQFRKTIDSPSFLESPIEYQQKVIQAHTTKFTATLNALSTKGGDDVISLMKKGSYPPEMIDFLEKAKKSDTLLYLKRFWNINGEDAVKGFIGEMKATLLQITKDAWAIYTTGIKKIIFSTEGGWGKGLLKRAKDAAKDYDPRTSMGTYFFTNQFMGITNFMNFAIRQKLFKSGSSFLTKSKKFAQLLALSYAGYIIFAVARSIVETAFTALGLAWNNLFAPLIPSESLRDQFTITSIPLLENTNLFTILGAEFGDTFMDQFTSFFDGDNEDKTSIKDMILATLPTLGLTSFQNSVVAQIIEKITGKDIDSVPEITAEFIWGVIHGFMPDGEEDSKKELEEATGNAVPEITPEMKYNTEVERIISNISNQLNSLYFRAKNDRGVFPGEVEKKKLLEKIKYDGTYSTTDPEVDYTKFYIEVGGKKYFFPKVEDVTGTKWNVDGTEVGWLQDPNLKLKLWEENYMKKLEKKIINEVLNLNTYNKKTYSSKKQNIILTESQLQNLMLKLK